MAAASAAPQEATAHLRDLLVALGLLADDGSVADAIESLVHQPALLVRQAIDGVTSRHDLAAALRRLLGARPADAATPDLIQLDGAGVTTTIDLAARSIALDATAGTGRFGWGAHVPLGPTQLGPAADWWVRMGSDHNDDPSGAAWFELDHAGARLRWRLPGDPVPSTARCGRPSTRRPSPRHPFTCSHALRAVRARPAREIDETTRPELDAVLDAFGLLDRSIPPGREFACRSGC